MRASPASPALDVKPSTRDRDPPAARPCRASWRRRPARCATIEDASYWPDCIKTLGDRFSYAFAWHFQNADVCKPFDLKAACKDGNCVSAQIERNLKLLKDDPKVPARERLMALAFLVHFVGDLHQPLPRRRPKRSRRQRFQGALRNYPRAICTRSGTAICPIAPSPRRRPGRPGSWPNSRAERAAIRSGTVQDWSRESWATTREFGYGALIADPCGPLPTSPPAGPGDDRAADPDVPPGGRGASASRACSPGGRAPSKRRSGRSWGVRSRLPLSSATHSLPSPLKGSGSHSAPPSPRGGSGPRRSRRSRAPRAFPCPS